MSSKDEYRVTIGSDHFEVESEDNLSARYRAAEIFKGRFGLGNSITEIVKFARAKLISAPEVTETTESVLKSLSEEDR